MKKLDDRIWSAYLDGELSVSEIEEVEGSLTGKQLEHFRKEKVLEEKINQRLEDGITCPTDLWQSICTKIGRGKSKSPKKIIYFSAFLSAAACLTIFFFLNKNAGDFASLAIRRACFLRCATLTNFSDNSLNVIICPMPLLR